MSGIKLLSMNFQERVSQAPAIIWLCLQVCPRQDGVVRFRLWLEEGMVQAVLDFRLGKFLLRSCANCQVSNAVWLWFRFMEAVLGVPVSVSVPKQGELCQVSCSGSVSGPPCEESH